MKKILFTFGTRPEAIKMAPLIKEFAKEPEKYQIKVCLTAQHRDMCDQVVQLFNLQVDYDLDLMKQNQQLHEVAPSIITRMRSVLEDCRPDLCFVQGDTTTTFATALACFYARVQVAHLEAGLRSHHRDDPFPEEINRRLTSLLAEYHFTPTERSRQHLMREGYPTQRIFVTGNTVVDALFMIQNMPCQFQQKQLQDLLEQLPHQRPASKLLLVTAHRRENFGAPMENIMSAIKNLAQERQDVHIVFPVHPNPNVTHVANATLGNIPNITLTGPLQYHEFITLMKACYFVLTDSGGVQEEAPYLQKPVLLLRQTTERPESIECGNIKMVGTDPYIILEESRRLLNDLKHYNSMSIRSNPYGDGTASKQIVQIISDVPQEQTLLRTFTN